MNTLAIDFEPARARQLYKTYREHLNAQTKVDQEIERIYYQIGRGRKVIRALASIAEAGLNAEGLPVLAIAKATAKECQADVFDNSIRFQDPNRWDQKPISVPGTFKWRSRAGRAMVPMIPIHLRPKAALANYHILWEADWKDVPVDPMLLRRIGGDAWLVVAAWDLTPVERAVLAGRRA